MAKPARPSSPSASRKEHRYCNYMHEARDVTPDATILDANFLRIHEFLRMRVELFHDEIRRITPSSVVCEPLLAMHEVNVTSAFSGRFSDRSFCPGSKSTLSVGHIKSGPIGPVASARRSGTLKAGTSRVVLAGKSVVSRKISLRADLV